MSRSASEQARRVLETTLQTHGVGLTESQKESGAGAAALGRTWSVKVSDKRGEKRIPALLVNRFEIKSKPKPGEKKPRTTRLVEEFVILDHARQKHWLPEGVPIQTFDSLNASSKATTVRFKPVTPNAKYVLEYGTIQKFKCMQPETRDLTQCALDMVWLSGVQYRREMFKEPKADGRKRRADGGGDDDDDEGGAEAGVGAEGGAAAGAASDYSPYMFTLYAATVETMKDDEAAAAWASFDALSLVDNPVRVGESPRQAKYLADIMGADWVCPARQKAEYAAVVRVDNTMDPVELGERGVPYRFAKFEKLLPKHWPSSFSRMIGPDLASQIERHVVQIERMGYQKPGEIMLQAYQSAGNNEAGQIVNMHLIVWQEDLLAFDLSLDEWKLFAPALFPCLKGRYAGHRTADLASDQTGALPDSDVNQMHIMTKGHLRIDVAETVLEAGFVLTPEQFDAQYGENLHVQGDTWYPPPTESDDVRHVEGTRPFRTRAVNLGRVSASLEKLRQAVYDGDAYVVMVTPWRSMSDKVRAATRAMEDRNEALKEFLKDNFYMTTPDENGNRPPPPMLFYAVSKVGPVARFLVMDAGAGAAAAAPAAAAPAASAPLAKASFGVSSKRNKRSGAAAVSAAEEVQ